jgi:hypothetical protein
MLSGQGEIPLISMGDYLVAVWNKNKAFRFNEISDLSRL